MPGRIYLSEDKYNIIMEPFQNPNITIAAICREHGIAVSLFYKWMEQFLYSGRNGFEDKEQYKSQIRDNKNIKAIIGGATLSWWNI